MSDTRWSLVWDERPAEEARNLNPAFCAELIARTVAEYHKARKTPLSIATAFLVLPLTLYKPTRNALPGRANTAFAAWIATNNPLLAELPGRVNRLRPVSREALIFSIRYGINALNGGGLVPGAKPIKLTARSSPTTDDVNDARATAALLGRWFGAQPRESAILQGFGVAP
ncbi:hypothetical protein ROJ8625_03611 [Roseivivax jejudonensis]|uniref:Uncharacterized protein n=1 Tax=Roseivivax jejudonensis TaxID=1529041 RepID=A0A1X7A361_9RHOB|nr:three component ABC system middle component [Roseivivax jejudonensis]SLN69245.1 hypothetical protein ROJ8625_03611 [Roseivivax jejudonensis]